MNESHRIIVIGAGHAGGEAVAALRAAGYDGHLTLVGAENEPPYQRPPLSKAFLMGKATEEELRARPHEFYEQQGVQLLLGQRAEHLDAAAKHIQVGGRTLSYDVLVLALGGSPRALPDPCGQAANVHYVKTIEDAVALRAALRPGCRIGVIGGGFVGLEVAASSRTLGAEVTVLEMAPRVLGRVCSETTAGHVAALHASRGVDVRTGVDAINLQLDADGNRVAGVVTDAGVVAVDEVVVGIGMTPETTLAADAGLVVEDGIIVDADYRTSVPDVFAIGDCARVVDADGASLRLESAPHASFSARRLAAIVTGQPAPDAGAPWFWSHQFEAKLQLAGDPRATPERWLVRGDVCADAFTVFGVVGDRVVRVESVNRPAEFAQAKMLLAQPAGVDVELLADTGFSLRQLIARPAHALAD